MIPLYAGNGGVIFKPQATNVVCGKGTDSGGHCGNPWCGKPEPRIPPEYCDMPGDCCKGSWPAQYIGGYLERTGHWNRAAQRDVYNEFIVDGYDYTKIDAFFMLHEDFYVRDSHDRFLRQYGLTNNQVPLVFMDKWNVNSPFSDVAE